MDFYYYRQDWSAIVEQLNQSLLGEQMVCSMSTQLFHIPATQNLKGNPEMHEHLVPASYHRVTAAGSARRLQAGEHHESIIRTLTSCVRNGLKEDREVMKWLHVMHDNAPQDYKAFIQHIISWQQQAEHHLSGAGQLIRQMGHEF